MGLHLHIEILRRPRNMAVGFAKQNIPIYCCSSIDGDRRNDRINRRGICNVRGIQVEGMAARIGRGMKKRPNVRLTLPRGLLCKSLRAKCRCSGVRDDVDTRMRIRGDCYADEAREATSLRGVKDVWGLLFNWGSFWVCSEVQCIGAARIRIILEKVRDSF